MKQIKIFYSACLVCFCEMEEKKTAQHMHTFGGSPVPKEDKPSRVAEMARQLEKSLDINHFLNIRFNRQNHGLYEKMCEERRTKEAERKRE